MPMNAWLCVLLVWAMCSAEAFRPRARLLMGLAASNERQQQQRQQHEEMSSDGQQLITKILQHSGS